ncbi:MAG TPA: hypothetical protein VF174_12760 [Micromonosporaceae bacterium]
MSKSSSRRPFGRATGTVTVVAANVHRSSARNARLAFVITALAVGLLSATVAADQTHPILAAVLGGLIGAGTGAVVWTVVRVWPVIRLVWWWLPEITLAVGLVYGWVALARATSLPVRLAVVAVVVGVPAAVPAIRRRLAAVAWCVIVRHRLRVCLAQFIHAHSSGSLPLILLARPTPVGERVWIYLRPGLSYADLNTRLDKIAVACHATSVVVEKASEKNSAFLRVDIKRRDVLADTVGSPLPGLVDPAAPSTPRTPGTLPTALDLPDVADIPTQPAAVNKPVPSSNGKPATTTATAAAVNGSSGEDISDWI